MKTILLNFANDSNNPLDQLKEEEIAIEKALSLLQKDGKIVVKKNSFATISSVSDDIYNYQNSIEIFHFSGHAGKDYLQLDNQSAHAEGILELLKNCPNIKLAFLNGCSTLGQTEGLLQAGIPLVISTTAPIGDLSAKEFASTFYYSLGMLNKTIDEAFANAKAKVMLSHKKSFTRGIGFRESNASNNDFWGLHYLPQNVSFTKFRLQEIDTNSLIDDFKPNDLIIKRLWTAILPNLSELQQSYSRTADQIDTIIQTLPHPVSDLLRKLIAKPTPGEKDIDFYNDLSANRLRFLFYTFRTCLDILTYTMLSQLWDEFMKNEKLLITPTFYSALNDFFSITPQNDNSYSKISLIEEVRSFFETENIPHFLEEFTHISKLFNQKSIFYESIIFFEKNREHINTIQDDQAIPLCKTAEINLSNILKELGFLARYKMSSMKSIEFVKYKHQLLPKYKHNFVELKHRPSGLSLDSEVVENSIDNASIVFLKETNAGVKFLNLSPFIFDINSFDEKSQLADLCIYKYRIPDIQSYFFDYVYKPANRPLRVDTLKKYHPIIHEQIESFQSLIAQRNRPPKVPDKE